MVGSEMEFDSSSAERTPTSIGKAFAKAIRLHQWVKNILVFLPLLITHDFSTEVWRAATLAFVSFCFAASAIYIINDLIDIEADRKHPTKRNRPFASGALDARMGPPLPIGFLILSFLTGFNSVLIFGESRYPLCQLAGRHRNDTGMTTPGTIGYLLGCH